MIRIKEIIIVEGRDDSAAIKRALDAQTIETHGFGIRAETLKEIKKAYEEKGIIILTDPDFSGEKIRRRLTRLFPNAKQAYLTVEEASQNGNIGVENATPEAIRGAIEKARAEEETYRETFSSKDMRHAGFAGSADAAQKRAAAGRILGIGYANAKTFQSRLNRYGITLEELNEAILACSNCGNQK